MNLVRSPATFITLVVLSAGFVVAQERESSKDIPSIARDALKSVVTVETKDGLGKPLGQGRGFIVSNDGKVITNYHVIQSAASGEMRFPDGASYLVEGIVTSNTERDLAVLKIKMTSNEFKFLVLGDSDRVQVGEQVVAVGSPLGLD